MIDFIVNMFMFVGTFLAITIGIGIAIFLAILVGADNINSNNNSSDDDDEDTTYIVEATNNTNLGYMQVGSCSTENGAIRAAEAYLRNGRSGWCARVVEKVNGKRRGSVWTS